MRRLVNLLLVITSLHVTGYTQTTGEDVWTLERCIQYAYDNNLEIKRSELATSAVQKDYNQSKYNLMPSLYGRVEHQLSSGRSLNLEEYKWENKSIQQGSMGMQADLTLFNGLQNYNNIQSNKFLLMSKLEDQESLKNNITLNLVAYYLQILLDKELVNVAKQKYDVTLMQVEKNEKLVQVGNIARGDLLEIQAQAASEKLNLVEAETEYRAGVLELTQILDLDSVGQF
ncbi:MAG TPA: TolC family protein, partial [Bacteroidales bacterium]|nr:TolC family protein [Bacteroidales bacterium]